MERKKIAILGISGSVGKQAADVAASRGYKVDLISANTSVCEAESMARRFGSRYAVMADESAARDLRARLRDTDTEVLSGAEGICEGVMRSESETVVNAIIGEAGLLPSLAVIDSGKRLALANKETLVIAGDIVMNRARERGVEIIPVDSEHSAIFQSLKSGNRGELKRILLTASGGPFFGKSKSELLGVTLSDALAHPTWKMGRKITVDSATLMNKGYEIIEAMHLFSTPTEKIEVLVHRESILHSAVEYIDNTVIAELSVPDMRMCVQYAVDYPQRAESSAAALDLTAIGKLTFQKPDEEAFPLLLLAKRAGRIGMGMPAVLNAADEVAVAAFLSERLSFVGISEVVMRVFDEMEKYGERDMSLDRIIALDREARQLAEKYISER